MSVHTEINHAQAQNLLANYAIGTLVKLKGITAGITNTNYQLQTTAGNYILTLFEQNNADELDFFLNLMLFLRQHNLPCPATIADSQQSFIHHIEGKPAAIIEFLPGTTLDKHANRAQCQALGQSMAMLHRLGKQFPGQIPTNSRGRDWHNNIVNKVLPKLSHAEQVLLQDEWEFQQQQPYQHLAHGLIHADVFRDNVLFDGDHLCGIIDFYYACHDAYLLDLATIVNDWCLDDNLQIHAPNYLAFMQAYFANKPFDEQQQQLWPAMLRRAALRFWLSRLHDWYFVADDPVVLKKDPKPLQTILEYHRQARTLPTIT